MCDVPNGPACCSDMELSSLYVLERETRSSEVENRVVFVFANNTIDGFQSPELGDGHVCVQNNSKLWLMFCIIIESNSQKTVFSIVLYTNMVAVTSGENYLYKLVGKFLR